MEIYMGRPTLQVPKTTRDEITNLMSCVIISCHLGCMFSRFADWDARCMASCYQVINIFSGYQLSEKNKF